MQPNDTNFLQSTKFTLAFDRIPTVMYFCQEVNIPGISTFAAEQESPFVKIYRPGDKLEFETLRINFLLDEDLKAWLEIFKWMQALAFPENFEQYRNLNNLSRTSLFSKKPQYSDGTLNILSALNNLKVRINFVDLFPVSLSSIDFRSTDENTTTLSATAEFRYTYYNFVDNL